MSRVRVQSFAISLDGYGAGPSQDLQNPLGLRGPELMEWFMPTRLWRKMQGMGDGETGVDNRMAEKGFEGIGAWILGRNMFGPVRGPWPDDSWKGWWGDEPPYHTPVFVLTHHARAPLAMAGGTEFRFITEGIHEALAQGRSKSFETTALYQRVFALADRMVGRQLPRAMVPSIKLGGPKIKRNLSTSWYAHRVDDRFKGCLNATLAARN